LCHGVAARAGGGGTVIQSTRRVVVKLSGDWPWSYLYQKASRRSNTLLFTA
jgi:hypothetical protein